MTDAHRTIEQQLTRYELLHVPTTMGQHRMETRPNGQWVLYTEVEKLLDRINMAACYASEENTEARVEALLLIGQLARQEIKP